MKKHVVVAIAWAFLAAHGFPSLATAALQRDVRVQAQDGDSRGQGFEEIEKKMKELIEELEKLQKDASQKIRKELIPRLEKEIERLKEWLRDFQLNPGKDPQTRKT
jgi:hypothetical protein